MLQILCCFCFSYSNFCLPFYFVHLQYCHNNLAAYKDNSEGCRIRTQDHYALQCQEATISLIYTHLLTRISKVHIYISSFLEWFIVSLL